MAPDNTSLHHHRCWEWAPLSTCRWRPEAWSPGSSSKDVRPVTRIWSLSSEGSALGLGKSNNSTRGLPLPPSWAYTRPLQESLGERSGGEGPVWLGGRGLPSTQEALSSVLNISKRNTQEDRKMWEWLFEQKKTLDWTSEQWVLRGRSGPAAAAAGNLGTC